MISIFKKHNNDIYNILLNLSRNKFFYEKISLPDTFETRIYLMFIHFSIYMIIFKKKGSKFDQKDYDFFFHNIEYNLRELGFGDVTVNKKMKDLNKILYDILIKIDLKKDSKTEFEISPELIKKYFILFVREKNGKLAEFIAYFTNFYNFCFELSLDNMLEGSKNFKL